MPKDAYYFPHDSNAQDDPKCMLLIDQLGMEGYGIFWAIIERLRNEEDFTLPITICAALAKRWGTSKEKIESVVKNYELFRVFEHEVRGVSFFSERLKHSMILKSEKARISASYRWENANALQPHSERNANGMRNDASKVKERKGKERKEGIKFSADNTKVFFQDGSSQKLGDDQLFMLSKGQLNPRDILKGYIY